MNSAATFQVYNASAGSGKTFTLVKEYLKILMTHEDIFTFQKILAITFTNKAAGEMKERVLKNLKEFSEGKQNIYFTQILEETNLDTTNLIRRSSSVLNAILDNYSAFYITTIDSFTYKIIKSFAFDLGLTQNFEVEMDADELLRQAVEALVSKIGVDDELTDVLIDFSLEKTDDDRSWDISRDLQEFSKVLLNENDASYFKKLSNKSISDFLEQKNKAKKLVQNIEKKFHAIGEKGLEIIARNTIDHKDFANRGECPNHFLKLTRLKFLKSGELKFDGRLNANFEQEKSLSAAKADPSVKNAIEAIYDELKAVYLESKQLYETEYKQYVLAKILLKSILPLTVLNNINHELNEIKEENNLRLNSEFNQLISENIQEQPAPFIYERIGQKFQHYFIDEMQDTSVLQWKNLIPLLDNSLSQEDTSLLLVGDGKQAIYRWRGGKAEQFIHLGEENERSENPFQIEKRINELTTNYRSSAEIIDFNNRFFQHISGFIQNSSYRSLFAEKSFQHKNDSDGGYVQLSFLEKEEDKALEKQKYARKALEVIQNLPPSFSLNDICILVRKKKEGVEIANYLSEKGIDIVSSETLLLSSSKKVNFIVDFLKLMLRPNDKELQVQILDFLHDHLKVIEDKHDFLFQLATLEIEDVFQELKKYDCHFNFIEFQENPLYEKVEYVLRSFSLIDDSDSYVQFFMDLALEQQRKESALQDFIDFWELKKDTLSITSSSKSDAVQIMTVHKSKGLEFPIVIFPCDLDIYKELSPKVWMKATADFPELLVGLNKDIQLVSEEGKALYQQRQEELELDNLNLLYVALTRPMEQLYVITNKDVNRSGVEKTNLYSGLFINYLKEIGEWSEDENQYSFGSMTRVKEKKEEVKDSVLLGSLKSWPWKSHNIQLLASSSKNWGTTQGEAKEYGDLIHEIMSKVYTSDQISSVLEEYYSRGIFNLTDKKIIEERIFSIVNHVRLRHYFTKEFQIYNEREIIDGMGQIFIPDRLLLKENTAIIIDYKTGFPNREHKQQLERYQKAVEEIGFNVKKKILIYIHDTISIEEF